MTAISSPTLWGRLPVKGHARVTVENVYHNVHRDQAGESEESFSQGSVTSMSNSYPLKILIPLHASYNQCKWIYPITFGGGLVGGDELQMSYHVKNNCCVLVTGQESTKIYHCEDSKKTLQTITGMAEDGALLCILSDPVVCYKDANFVQKQVFHFTPHSNLVYLDWLLAGRIALGEFWSFQRYSNQTDVYVNDTLVYRDSYQLEDTPMVTKQQAMQNFQVMGSCIILGKKLEQISKNLTRILGKKKSIGERHDPDVVCGVTQLTYSVDNSVINGVYIRFLASSSIKAYNCVISHIVSELEETIGGNPFEDKY